MMISIHSIIKIITVALLVSSASTHASPVWSGGAPPAKFEIYRTELFNLISREPSIIDGKSHYNEKFSAAWRELMTKEERSSPELERRLLSGPGAEGTYWSTGHQESFTYTACQARSCSETNLILAFEPQTFQMSGLLTDRCKARWIGSPSELIKSLLEKNSKELSTTSKSCR